MQWLNSKSLGLTKSAINLRIDCKHCHIHELLDEDDVDVNVEYEIEIDCVADSSFGSPSLGWGAAKLFLLT